jgi:hypothetical protein
MVNKLALCFSTLALATAFAADSYKVTVFDDSSIAGKQLKPGDYKVEVKESTIVLKHNKDVTEVPGSLQTGERKYPSTTIRYNDRREVQEICIGGTNKKIVISNGDSTAKGI